MDFTALQPVLNLGVAGFSIWIMWKMYELSSKRFQEKDRLHSEQISNMIDKHAKERETEIAKRDAVEREVRENIMSQLAENTQALRDITSHIQTHH